MHHRHSGLSLVEIIIVVALLGILFAAAVYLLDPIRRLHAARNGRRAGDIEQIANGADLTVTDRKKALTLFDADPEYWQTIGKSGSGCFAYCGKMGALYFNGTSYETGDGRGDYVSVANQAPFDFDINTPFSIALWYKPREREIYATNLFYDYHSKLLDFMQVLVGKYQYFERQGWLLAGDETGVYFTMLNGPSQSTPNPFNVPEVANAITVRYDLPGEWPDTTPKHVVVTYDGSGVAAGIKMYVNGADVNSALYRNQRGTISTIRSPAPLTFSMPNKSTYVFVLFFALVYESFHGEMDDVRIYNTVLSPSDVQTVYTGLEPPASPTAHLISRWLFNTERGQGNVVRDYVGGNDGTFVAGDFDGTGKPTLPSFTGSFVPQGGAVAIDTCIDAQSDLKKYLPKMPQEPLGGTPQNTIYAANKEGPVTYFRACKAEGIGPGGTGDPPVIENQMR